MPDIYIATVLLEPNRWAGDKTPQITVSDWLPRFADAGFDGVELWQYHASLVAPAERAALRSAPLPIRLLNTYVGFTDGERAERQALAALGRELGVAGVKFNFGRQPEALAEYQRNYRSWRQQCPDDWRMLCECHGGTVLETPEAAAAAFAGMPAADIQLITHAFAEPPEVLRQKLELFGDRLTHIHVARRNPDADELQRLDRQHDACRETLAVLADHGFNGTLTVEFTEGVAQPSEDAEQLFANAVADLYYLREHLT
jgi:sugar phosphate isomerase/epimerase